MHQFAGPPIEAAVFGTWPEWHWLPGVEPPEPVTRGEAFDAWTYVLQQWPLGVERPMPGESTSSTAELLLAAA
ncbi:MAG: hypothetical protein P1V35_08240, partial [Planctomycetota bacterium]|nr:hypothetical protein [Planctomycetota bacterium]